ncbi:unnamed protein product [Schistosoma bovis]|nr:unnamed protein product [Schistosoma bovis]
MKVEKSSLDSSPEFHDPGYYNMENRIDSVTPLLHRFPYSIVWTPIPLLTWFFPFIGHMGIANSYGVIYDFAGPYTIGEDQMAFGWPTMYYQPHAKLIGSREVWDNAISEANEVYKGRVCIALSYYAIAYWSKHTIFSSRVSSFGVSLSFGWYLWLSHKRLT